MKISSLFISKNEDEVQALQRFCAQGGIHLLAQSFISFELIPYKIQSEADVFFFGSKNAFLFFLDLKVPFKNKRLAVIGEVTKNYIEKLGYEVAFFSPNAGNPEQVAKEFQGFLKGRKVAFFQSDLSKRSISGHFPETQREEYVIYSTKLNTIALPEEASIYVFTSPSNVDAFLLQNKLPVNTKIIAWGKITEKALREKGVYPDITLISAKQEELIERLKEIISF